MNIKYFVGGFIIIIGIALGAINFFDSQVEYGTFAEARKNLKKIQVKGTCVNDLGIVQDNDKTQFVFFMKDDNGEVMKVVLAGMKPNNFDLAQSIVVKGKASGDYFQATEILTKCPSKYQGATDLKKDVPQ